MPAFEETDILVTCETRFVELINRVGKNKDFESDIVTHPLQELTISKVSNTGSFTINASLEMIHSDLLKELLEDCSELMNEIFNLAIVYQDSIDTVAEDILFSWYVK